MCKLEVAIGLMAAGLLVAVNEGLSVALGSRRPQWWSMCVWVFKGGLLYLAPSRGGAHKTVFKRSSFCNHSLRLREIIEQSKGLHCWACIPVITAHRRLRQKGEFEIW